MKAYPPKTRNLPIDVISGFFIIEIIIQHVLQNCNLYNDSWFEKYIIGWLPIFMPWFFFKSGIMFKKPTTFNKCFSYRWSKLIYPFIIWSIVPSLLMFPLVVYREGMGQYFKNIIYSLAYAYGPYNLPLWFLITLFMSYIVINVLELRKINRGGIIAAAIITSYAISLLPFKIPFGLNRLPLAIFCFELGIILKKYNLNSSKWAILSIVCYVIVMTLCPSDISFHKNVCHGNYFVAIISISSFMTFTYCIIQKQWTLKILQYIGEQSMIPYVSHATIIVILKYINKYYYKFNDVHLALIMTFSILLLTAILMAFRHKLSFLFIYKVNN